MIIKIIFFCVLKRNENNELIIILSLFCYSFICFTKLHNNFDSSTTDKVNVRIISFLSHTKSKNVGPVLNDPKSAFFSCSINCACIYRLITLYCSCCCVVDQVFSRSGSMRWNEPPWIIFVTETVKKAGKGLMILYILIVRTNEGVLKANQLASSRLSHCTCNATTGRYFHICSFKLNKG